MLIVSAKHFGITEEQVERLYAIIIQAYAETEKEIWGEGYVRVSREDFQEMIEKDEIFVALLKGKIVGGIRMFQLGEKIWSFSLLGADFKHKGQGIGRALIEKVEEETIKRNGDRIRIEVLRAEGIEVVSKEILSNWYQKLGYELVKTIDVFEVYNDAEKWSKLVNPSVFDCYEKVL